MMKYVIFFCFSMFWHGVYAESPQYLTKDQIIITETGIYLLCEDGVVPTNYVKYVGNGYFIAEYYGQCKTCHWPLNKKEECVNQNCKGYNPKEKKK